MTIVQLPGIPPGPAAEPAKKNGVAPHAHAHSKIPKAIVDALRAEMKSLVEGEDLDANLIRLEQLVGRTRELFMTFKAPQARFNRGGGPLSFVGYGGYGSMDY